MTGVQTCALPISGKLVILKTDTLYALSCDASNEDAVQKIFALKNREFGKALPILVSDIEQGEIYAEFNDLARRLESAFWPGPLTLILPSRGLLPSVVDGGAGTLALRAPNHPHILKLIKSLGHPIIGTSANISGSHDIIALDDIIKYFGTSVGSILDLDSGQSGFGIAF